VRLILDPNKDAFGRQKDGVPNRPVANELVTRSGERIEVRWYKTNGEQFHTKLAMITRNDRFIASLGSANLTRRNLGNYNLEANVAIDAPLTQPLAIEMLGYFDRLWNNDGEPGTEFTAPFGAYRDDDWARYWRYRVMEATGLSTF
jgi:phosphatidylserine/phosphatidylglycerophosphate/cardiolipin synthase-like enzyme